MEHKHHSPSQSSTEMHLRCPTCFKLYAVDASTIYVAKPEFACTQCEEKFWVNFPEALEYSEVVAFPVEWNENYKVNVTSEEMAERALADELDQDLLAKMSFESETARLTYQEPEAQKDLPLENRSHLDFAEESDSDPDLGDGDGDEVGTPEWKLDREWEKVLNNYDVRTYHDGFISEGKKLGALEHVYEKYKNLRESNPFDVIAKNRFKQVERLVQKYTPEVTSTTPNKAASASNMKSPGLKAYAKYLPWISLAIAGGLIAAGFSHESLNHLAGLGFALIFLTGALSLLKESDL